QGQEHTEYLQVASDESGEASSRNDAYAPAQEGAEYQSGYQQDAYGGQQQAEQEWVEDSAWSQQETQDGQGYSAGYYDPQPSGQEAEQYAEPESVAGYQPLYQTGEESSYSQPEEGQEDEGALPPPLYQQDDATQYGVTNFPGESDKDEDKYQPWSTFGPVATVSPADPTFWSRLFDGLAFVGPLVLIALYLFQVFFGIQELRLLWHPDEVIQASILHGVLNVDWFQLQYNGQPFMDYPPLYFWFLAGVHKVLQTVGLGFDPDYARTLFTGAATSGLLLLLATMALAKWAGRLERRGVFASGLVLLGTFFFASVIHYANIDLFFSALLAFSLLFIFIALQQRSSLVPAIIGFLFAGLAVMTKGPYGLILPLAAALVYTIAQGQPGRFFKLDILVGVIVALLPTLGWLGYAWFSGMQEMVLAFLPALGASLIPSGLENPQNWICFGIACALIWAPWTILVLLLPGSGLFGRAPGSPSSYGAGRGVCFIWCALISGLLLLIAASLIQPLWLIAVFPALAIATGRGVLRLSPVRGMIFQRIMAILFVILAVLLAVLPVYLSGKSPELFTWLDRFNFTPPVVELRGLFVISAVFLVMGCLFLGASSARRSENALLILALGVTAIAYPMNTMTVPSLNTLLSPQGAVQNIIDYSGQGYKAATFSVKPGTFQIMSGGAASIVDAKDKAELDALLNGSEKLVVAMPRSEWEAIRADGAPSGVSESMGFYNGFRPHVLLIKDKMPDIPGS
ncbi:glycosyltransferase family 39 protein, partial [Desulfovibrio sp. OttesenSCG-928-C14]|nr:glycosyltransferase family 39 protein [Desulfovibrio sp. OttesenSCG-928-C14]